MIGTVKLLLAGGLLASLPVLPAVLPQMGQDPATLIAQDPFQQEALWNFAVLQYTNDAGQTVEVAASAIAKLWLVSMGHGRMRLELLYQNRDYSQVDLRGFSIIRRSNAYAAVDIPIIRTTVSGMAFPAFK